MFLKHNTYPFREVIEGVRMQPLAYGFRTNLCEFRLKKGFTIPPHNHPYEQTGYLVSGKLNFRIGEKWFLAQPGDSWSIPLNEEHEVETLEDSVVLELFSPLRPDYLPK